MKEKNKILVVVDMQADFVSGSLGSEAAKAIVPEVVEKIRNWDGWIIATRDTHKEQYLSSHEGRYLPVPHCIEGSEGWQIIPEVTEALEKHDGWAGARNKVTFGDEGLPAAVKELLERGGISDYSKAQITLIGLDTDICVISNALILRAAFPETDMAVDSACCAGSSPEAHAAALTILRSCQIEVL